MIKHDMKEERHASPSPMSAARGPVWVGFAFVLLFLFVFVGWGSLYKLAGGAVAPGTISPEGSRRTVQHLEGGIIQELIVRDGGFVQAGQPLLTLSTAQPRASYDVILTQQRALLATYARLEAERTGKAVPEFPAELQGDATDLLTVIDEQLQILNTRRDLHNARKRVLRQRIEQANEQIKGFQAQISSASRQQELLAQEIAGKSQLQEKGLIPLPMLLALQRVEAEIAGRQGEYVAAIARTKQQIGETELELISRDSELADQIARELAKTRVDLANITERLTASRDVLSRTVITSPLSGTVVNMKFKTKGGVIRPGEPILDIVPADEALLINAQISPTDIDVIHAGLSAIVTLSAFSSRDTPRVHGVVREVSADRLVEEKTGRPYYLARVEVDRRELNRLGPTYKLVPGMPAEVLIVTSERTMFEYLFQPFVDSIRRSLREV
jgi:HlyD family secretion protein